MERRRQRRYARRMVVHFVENGGTTRYMGYSTNISHTGMFISCTHLVPPGVCVVLELAGRTEPVTVEAEAVRQRIVPMELRSLHPSGFGVRFVGDVSALSTILPPEAVEAFASEEPSVRAAGAARPAAVPLVVAPAGSTAVASASSVEGTLLKLRLSGPVAVAELLRRELRFGAIFVSSVVNTEASTLGRGAPVTVQVTLGARSVHLVGRVAATAAHGVTVALNDLTGASQALGGLLP